MRIEELKLPMVALLLLALPGCGEGVGGDWFGCKDGDVCQVLDDDGYRFEGGQWFELEADGSSLEPGETYCVDYDDKDSGTYQWNGDTLTMHSHSGTVTTLTVDLRGDRALWSTYGFAGWYREVLPTRSHGPCN